MGVLFESSLARYIWTRTGLLTARGARLSPRRRRTNDRKRARVVEKMDRTTRALVYGDAPFAFAGARERVGRLNEAAMCAALQRVGDATRSASASASDGGRGRRATSGVGGTFAASAVNENASMKFAKDVFAGTCGGITVTLLGHPFDTVKVLLQTQSSKNPVYSGAVDAASKVIKAEGVGGLYRGVTSPLAGQMFFRATLFFAYARAKEFVGVSPEDPLSYAKAGALAWLAGTFFESPIDLYKSQWQCQLIKAKADPAYKSPYNSVLDVVKESWKHNGIRGPYQAFHATMARNLPAGAVYFGVFENAKNTFAKMNDDGKATNAQIIAAGGIGGFFYWSLFYPIDVIKSALMTDAVNPAQRKFSGFFDAAGKLYTSGGVRAFYRGLVPCLLRASPANAGMLFTVDYIRRIID